jgi:hypothetical protein
VDDVQFAHDPVAGNQVTLRKRRKNVAGGASVA